MSARITTDVSTSGGRLCAHIYDLSLETATDTMVGMTNGSPHYLAMAKDAMTAMNKLALLGLKASLETRIRDCEEGATHRLSRMRYTVTLQHADNALRNKS